jgi:hypothetical protein
MCLIDYNLFKSVKLSEYYRKQFEKEAIKKDQQQQQQQSQSASTNKQKDSMSSQKREKEKSSTQQIQPISNILKITERFNQVTY